MDYLKQNEEIARRYVIGNLIRTGIITGAFLIGLLLILIFTGKIKFKSKKAKAAEAVAEAAGAASVAENITSEADEVAAEDEKEDDKQLIEELIIKKSSEIERVEKLVDKYPETAVQILRTWLSED